MKKHILTIVILLISKVCLSQSFLGNQMGNEHDFHGGNENHPEQDSTQSKPKKDIKHVRTTWLWEKDGVYKKHIPLDTLYNKIHVYNYAFQKSISNTHLGNNPSPYESNIFINRQDSDDFFYLNKIRAYLIKYQDIQFYNTTTPFTQLRYYSGGSRGSAEQQVDMFHTQNIKPWWNVGFKYLLNKGEGRYSNQDAKAYNLSIFTNYEKKRNTISFFLNQNNGHFEENGGVANRNFITDTTTFQSENIPVNLQGNGVENRYRNTNFNFQVQHGIGKPRTEVIAITNPQTPKEKEKHQKQDSSEINNPADTIYSYALKAVLNIRAEGNERFFTEENINEEFFANTYIHKESYVDNIRNQVYDISAKIVLNDHPRFTYFPQAYIGANYKQDVYKQRLSYDTINGEKHGTEIFRNVYASAGIFNIDTNAVINYDLNAKLALVGDYIGDFEIDGNIKKSLKKDWSSYIQADANISLKHPNPFYNRYIGNHDIWTNDFNAIKDIDIRGKYVNTNTRTEIGVGINNRIDHIYFDTTALPIQTNKTILTTTAWGKKIFKAGNFYFDQTAYFQFNTQDDIISLPLVSLYSHNYYKNNIFKDALGVVIGVDLFYNTSFYADNYRPSTMMFYQQRKHKTGNYPQFDVFANFEIQRAIIFVKYEHLNYLVSKAGNYFSAADYPINPAMFKFGVRWNFFD